MKKLLLISAFFIFACSYGQTYEDIISIDSKEQFIRVATENNFSLLDEQPENIVAMYRVDDYGNINTMSFKIKPGDGYKYGCMVQYAKEIIQRLAYNKVYENVKGKCKYKEIFGDWVAYDCPDFEGLICFSANSDENYSILTLFN